MNTDIQQVVVYRNPAEAALWNMLSGDVGVYFFIFVVAMFITLLVATSVDTIVRRYINVHRVVWSRMLFVMSVMVFIGVAGYLLQQIGAI